MRVLQEQEDLIRDVIICGTWRRLKQQQQKDVPVISEVNCYFYFSNHFHYPNNFHFLNNFRFLNNSHFLDISHIFTLCGLHLQISLLCVFIISDMFCSFLVSLSEDVVSFLSHLICQKGYFLALVSSIFPCVFIVFTVTKLF